MPAQVGNWVRETTATSGTGAITLSGAVTGFAAFATIPDGLVWYSIGDADDREAGMGTLSSSGTVLTRTTVSATLVSGVYDDTSPTAITLSGTAEVWCTFNKTAFDELAAGGAALGKNLLIGNFRINQRAVPAGAGAYPHTIILSAGEYGHDRWKAGAGGCTYEFTGGDSGTTDGLPFVEITAGTLMQEVAAFNTRTGDVVFSWDGTAQGRIDTDSYGASGVTKSIVGGTVNTTVEVNTGTLQLPQLEVGTVATEYEWRDAGLELDLCTFYYERFTFDFANIFTVGQAYLTTAMLSDLKYATKLQPPVLTAVGSIVCLTSLGVGAGGTIGFGFIGTNSCRLSFTGASGLSVGDASGVMAGVNGDYIEIDSEL